MYAKNSKPLIIINGDVISVKDVKNTKNIKINVLFLYLCFVKTKKCKITIAKSPKTKVCGKISFKIPDILLEAMNFSSSPK